MTIKHLIFCGGGPIGLFQYGFIKKISIEGILKLENIKSVYATSIGCYVSLIYLLNLDWEWMDDFLIKRPWEKLININNYDYYNLIYTKGLIHNDFFLEVIKPVLLARDLDENSTLKELYDITKIDFHIFTCKLNGFQKVDLNHLTYPDLEIYKACMMSCCIPIVFEPIYYNNSYYLDGGIFCNSPINDCYNNYCNDDDFNEEQILAFENNKDKYGENHINNHEDEDEDKYKHEDKDAYTEEYEEEEEEEEENDDNSIEKDSNIFDFLIYILKKIIINFINLETLYYVKITNLINANCTKKPLNLKYWKSVFSNSKQRIKLINQGIYNADNFIKQYKERIHKYNNLEDEVLAKEDEVLAKEDEVLGKEDEVLGKENKKEK